MARDPEYAGFGPTLLAEEVKTALGVCVSPETMRAWLARAGLWTRQRKRAKHRSRRTVAPHGASRSSGTARCMDGSRTGDRPISC